MAYGPVIKNYLVAYSPACIYFFKVNNWRCSCVFNVKFEYISQLFTSFSSVSVLGFEQVNFS